MTPQEPFGEEGGAFGIARTVRRYEKVPMFCDMGTFFGSIIKVGVPPQIGEENKKRTSISEKNLI